ncbi:MAG TPA: protein-glutamate O-methyltransferase CheR [Byssovorax sp.]|jgi:chemotaxis protein methyltransferase CheR
MKGFTLSDPLFAILSALVEERVGLHYELLDASLFAGKLGARALEAGFESALDYYYFLRYDDKDGAEFAALTDALVVNETYLFREADALRAVVREVVEPAVREARRPRVWCAACSTGEEPVSLALLLAEAGLLDRVDIVASDVSAGALSRARAGVYGGRSLRALEGEAVLARRLEQQGAQVTAPPEVRAAITYHRVNLLDDSAVAALGAFDAIVCRNVLIYFSDARVVEVVERLSRALSHGGLLLVGASESLLRFGTMLETVERAGTFFYRKARA